MPEYPINISATLAENLKKYASEPAFYIRERSYSYAEFAVICGRYINHIRQNNYKVISVYAIDDVETYAAILAIFISGRTFMPIHPENPKERSVFTLESSHTEVLYTVEDLPFDVPCKIVKPEQIHGIESDSTYIETNQDNVAYILFTSGSTGVPKGVPITYKNIGSFLAGFFNEGITLGPGDRVLQMFHLTFDLSLCSYLTGLLHGACVYTMIPVEVRYLAVYEMLEKHQLTFAIMVPSIISYLRPFFTEIKLPHLRYNHFCGESLYLDLINEWRQCVPNARLFNIYGPTEDVICTSYEIPAEGAKSMNGIVCVGKPYINDIVEVFDENCELLPTGSKGEFCLAGPHLTHGYITDPEKYDKAFFHKEINGKDLRFYHSGDVGIKDESGDMFYLGRNDNQVKVLGGYRVELSEVEFHAMQVLPDIRLVAVTRPKSSGVSVIHIVLEDGEGKSEELRAALRISLPEYMQPDDYHSIPAFPLSPNGKIDRRQINKIVFGE